MERRDFRKDQPNAAPEEEQIVCAPFSCGAKWADGQARGRFEKPFTLLSRCSTDSVLVREQLALQWTHQRRAAWRVEPRPPGEGGQAPLGSVHRSALRGGLAGSESQSGSLVRLLEPIVRASRLISESWQLSIPLSL